MELPLQCLALERKERRVDVSIKINSPPMSRLGSTLLPSESVMREAASTKRGQRRGVADENPRKREGFRV